MATSKEELKSAINVLLNDVIEQGFHHLIRHPQRSDALNRIIKDATDELGYLNVKIDAHSFKANSPQLHTHYESISKDAQRKSMDLLSLIQKIQIADNPRLKRI